MTLFKGMASILASILMSTYRSEIGLYDSGNLESLPGLGIKIMNASSMKTCNIEVCIEKAFKWAIAPTTVSYQW